MTLPAVLPDFLTTPGANPALLRDELVAIIRKAIEDHPRSLQVRIGPSEVGHPCARRLGYKLLDYDENPGEPNWKATVGTAIHSYLEEVFGADDAKHYAPGDVSRWVLEATVCVGEVLGQEIDGHCDLYDQVTYTVVDWKTCGPTQLKKYRAQGPGPQYRAQAHLYGRGWARQGRRVDHVAVMFLPRNGDLREAHYWTEPYDEQVALDALRRLEGIQLTVNALGDQALRVLPTADAFCSMCPYHLAYATDFTRGCPGDPAAQRPRTNPALTLG